MFNLPLSVVIEALVAILLVITIVYCILLNSRLKRLRADEEGLRATIAELLTATEIAERAIHGLRTTSAQCDQTLGKRIEEAREVSDALATQLTASNAGVQRQGKAAGTARQGSTAAASKPASRPASAVAPSASVAAAPIKTAPKAPTPARKLDDAARALQDRLQRIAS